ncbi:hypothetical protein WA026_017118, partial [Henosepilachna vigintioctopunctata]
SKSIAKVNVYLTTNWRRNSMLASKPGIVDVYHYDILLGCIHAEGTINLAVQSQKSLRNEFNYNFTTIAKYRNKERIMKRYNNIK